MHDQIIITSNNQLHNTQEYMCISVGSPGNGLNFVIGEKITIHQGNGPIIGYVMDQSKEGNLLICEVK